MLVDVTDALQDLVDAVAKRETHICKSWASHPLTRFTGKGGLRWLPGICLAVVLPSNDVLKQLSSSDAADRQTERKRQFSLRPTFHSDV